MTHPAPFLALALLLTGSAAFAQADRVVGPMIPPAPYMSSPYQADIEAAERANRNNDPAEALARYLHVLAQDPHHLEALTGAGHAALDIGDANAAATFYARADELAPHNGQIKAGLGSAMVQLMQSRIALKLFDEALDLGVAVFEVASDRGLAYDLQGDYRRARADYELALKVRPNNAETIRRLAISQAIAGDALGALGTLDPLLRKQDKAAWRMRAFILAISGDMKGADEAARSVLTKPQADALKPFLVRLPKLRPSQQAVAVHFGQFPSDGHKYSPEELAAASGISVPTVPVTSTLSKLQAREDARQAEKDAMADDLGDGVDLDKPVAKSRKSRAKDSEKPFELALDLSSELEREKAGKPARSDKTEKAEKPDKTDKAEKAEADARAKEAKAKEKEKQKEADKKAEKLEKDKKDKDKKDKDKKDQKDKIEKADKDAKDSKKKGAERYWVQVATGSYKPDLGKEWTRLKTKYPALLGRWSPWTTPLNKTNRLMIGPFKTSDEAQAFVNKAAGSGFGTSRVATPAGQTVERISN